MAEAPAIRLPPMLVGEELDYGVDFRHELGTATITACAVTAPTGITLMDPATFDGSIVTARLRADTPGDYTILFAVTASDGQKPRGLIRIMVYAVPSSA